MDSLFGSLRELRISLQQQQQQQHQRRKMEVGKREHMQDDIPLHIHGRPSLHVGKRRQTPNNPNVFDRKPNNSTE